VANTRSAIKRVRQSARRARINGPRRTAAKTHVAKALRVASGAAQGDPAEALADAMAALDRAAKSGAIHPNAAARRKSRLARKLNAALGGVAVEPTAKARTTGKAASAKAARARVAAARARAEAGPKTAAGKARVALAKKTIGEPKAAAAKPGTRATGVGKAAAAKPGTRARGVGKAATTTPAGSPAEGADGKRTTTSRRRSGGKTEA